MDNIETLRAINDGTLLTRRLILPGEPRRGPLQILVPRGHETKPIAVCRVPVGGGRTCGTEFWPGQEAAFERHVRACVRKHEAEIHAESPRTRMPIFRPEAWDPELTAHMKRVGDRMLEEGRMTVKKNERAGFS